MKIFRVETNVGVMSTIYVVCDDISQIPAIVKKEKEKRSVNMNEEILSVERIGNVINSDDLVTK